MSSGWVGPGARSSPQNKFENDNYQATKRRLEAEEEEKKDIENARRISMGEKPCMYCIPYSNGEDWLMGGVMLVKDSVWTKIKKLLKRSMM